MRQIVFVANYNLTADPARGLSGGDRIWLELMRRWWRDFAITLVGSRDTLGLAEYHGITGIKTMATTEAEVSKERSTSRWQLSVPGLLWHTITRTFSGLLMLVVHHGELAGAEFIYSVSDFYPDLLPVLLYKLFLDRQVKWVAGYFLFAPHPLAKDSPYKGWGRCRGLLYWLTQQLSFRLVRRFADFILVTSEPDVKRFVTAMKGAERVLVVHGGVDTSASEAYLNSGRVIPVAVRKYDSCFMARLHVQKGVLELIRLWRLIVDRRPEAQLALIGNGELEGEVRKLIKDQGLEENVERFGFLDGEKKYEIFKNSKIVVHPATYDSGGMAAAEAMAWGLPGVSFDLESLKTYYPKGVVKTSCFNLRQFAGNILRLLEDTVYYAKMSKDAHDLITEEWDWDKRAAAIIKTILK